MTDPNTRSTAMFAAFDECAYVWRLSQTHDLATLRAFLRRRLEGLAQDEPSLAVRLEVLRAECVGWHDYT